MPLINGLKMACGPCIRGHRSTKCTHANERLMVPVRKPGRPLSTCPHPQNLPCSCGSVTAAISRKQACHCGPDSPLMSSEQPTPQDFQSSIDLSSPTKPTFKVQKTIPRPSSSRKLSFDPVNFERLDMNNINVIPYEQRPQTMPAPFTNGYSLPPVSQPYAYSPSSASPHTQFNQIPVHPALHAFEKIPQGYNGLVKENEERPTAGNGLATLTEFVSNDFKEATETDSCCAPPMPTNRLSNSSNSMAEGGSCCATKQSYHSHSSSSASSLSEPAEIEPGNCCSAESALMTKQETMSSHGTPIMSLQMLPPEPMFLSPSGAQHSPQTTVFTYPPTYGSFQNPLQPSAWRHRVIANSIARDQMQVVAPSRAAPHETPVGSESLDTVHTCRCGDGCQCVGCAAHPYNDATQNYVRSALRGSMNVDQNPDDAFVNGVLGEPNFSGAEALTSANVDTPSSMTAGNGEEQNFAAADFLFVNYSFPSEEGCGGDTESCPCGDDCQCFGCSIHQNPGVPSGVKTGV